MRQRNTLSGLINKKIMQVLEIEEKLMTEICEAADFENKTCSEYVNSALKDALRKTENRRLEPEREKRHRESYEKFPQELDDSEEEWAYWQKVYEESERSAK